jgi:tagaturonate reductase
VPDLLPYERLKLFILNLGHTVLAEQWLASSTRPRERTVCEAVSDPASQRQLCTILEDEVLPVFASLGMAEQASAYRDTVLERFANPLLRHQLADIAVNHAAKKQRRIAPLLALAKETGAPATPRLASISCSSVEASARSLPQERAERHAASHR